MEQLLGLAVVQQVIRIQCAARVMTARRCVKRMRKARKLITRMVYTLWAKKKLRKIFSQGLSKIKRHVVRLQRCLRWKRRYNLVMAEIQRRIKFNKQLKEKARQESLKKKQTVALSQIDADQPLEEGEELKVVLDRNRKHTDATSKVSNLARDLGRIEQIYSNSD